MSQVDLNGEEVSRKEHLTRRFPGERASVNGSRINPGKDREYYCEECCYRVTESVDGGCEYGHAKDCKHSVWGDGR